MKKLLFLCSLICVSSLFAQESSKMRVAIFDFKTIGYMDFKGAEIISESIRSEITKSHLYEVVERNQVDGIFKEQGFQLSGLTDEAMLKIGELLSVRQIIIGSIGLLNNTMLVTLRLVDAESGKILFAETLYSDDMGKGIFDDIKQLVEKMSTQTNYLSVNISIDEVNNFYKNRDYKRAWLLLNRFMENHRVSSDVQSLKKDIESKLANQFYREAKKLYLKHHYTSARRKINEAVAVAYDEKYLLFRNKIIQKEEKLAEELESEKEEMRIKAKSESEQVRLSKKEYLESLDPSGVLINYSTGFGFMGGSAFDKFSQWHGFDITLMQVLNVEKVHSISQIHPNFMFNFNFRYEPKPDFSEITYNFNLSPFSGVSFKMADVILDLNLHAGLLIKTGVGVDNTTLFGFSSGGLVSFQLKFWKRVGLNLGFLMQYEYYPNDLTYSGLGCYLTSGFVF